MMKLKDSKERKVIVKMKTVYVNNLSDLLIL